jgi:hypothetical protein
MPKASSVARGRLEPVIVWLCLCGIVVLVKVLVSAYYPVAFADPDQAALFRWSALASFFAAGSIGALLADRCGFPQPRSGIAAGYSHSLAPGATGAAIGIAMVSLDRFTGLSKVIAAHHQVQQQYTGFVPMFLVFVCAAPIIVEVVYRLFLLPVLLWFISTAVLRGRHREATFWVLALILSALEPFTQTPDLRVLSPAVRAADAAVLYGLNLTQALYFRKSGYLASILVRAGFYLVWHVLYVH